MSQSQILNIIYQRPNHIFRSLLAFIIAFSCAVGAGLVEFIHDGPDGLIYFYYLTSLILISIISYFGIFRGRPVAKIPLYLLAFTLVITAFMFFNDTEKFAIISKLFGFLVIVSVIISSYYLMSAKTTVWFKACKLARKGELPEDYQERFFRVNKSVRENADQIRPWIRYWARNIDLTFFGFFTVTFIVSAFMISAFILTKHFASMKILFVFLGIFLFIILPWLIEAAFLSCLGTTPGKWLFSIKIRDIHGNKPSFSKALNRTIRVYTQGLALFLPIVNLATLIIAYSTLTKDGITSWDKNCHTSVIHNRLRFFKVAIAIFLFIITWIALVLLSQIKT